MIAKSAGFMFVCIGLTLLTSGLLVSGHISESVWSSTVMFIWGAQVFGGVGKVAADRWAEAKNGKNGVA